MLVPRCTHSFPIVLTGCVKRACSRPNDRGKIIHCTHSFIQAISVPVHVDYYSEALPTQQHGYCVRGHRELRVKDLPKAPTWRLVQDSNPQPFGRKALNLPMSHHARHVKTENLEYNNFDDEKI